MLSSDNEYLVVRSSIDDNFLDSMFVFRIIREQSGVTGVEYGFIAALLPLVGLSWGRLAPV